MESSNGAQRLEKIELLASLNPKDKAQLEELCDYLPSHPAEATIYGWTMRKKMVS